VSPVLLMDLDETLLDNRMESFLPAYLQALSAHLAAHTEPKRMVKTLLAGTEAMARNLRPDRTLQETFDAVFFPVLGLERQAVQPVIDAFYVDEFPKLCQVTRPIAGAVELVNAALERGWQVVIATNPLFPEMAILHRLDWAGLTPALDKLALVSSYQAFHYAKPHPEFVMECLARLGWPEGPVVMVGNDLENDIACAAQAGLASFWITPDGGGSPAGAAATGHGALKDLLPWLDAADAKTLEPDFSSQRALLAALRAGPAGLTSLAGRDLQKRPAPGEWNATETLCHLRDVEAEVFLPRLRRALREDAPVLAGLDSKNWPEERAYAAQDPWAVQQAFTAARMELLAELDSLPEDAWKRTMVHPSGSQLTVLELVGRIAAHDRNHARQALAAVCS